ncbi:major facilitator superfamily domain-containing protein [Mycena maculata]|uniref:Major facilitator superfamily domain-containing protein n=1 Tax=Mycena maculata TaxID=230809 RepID=A0AAD7JY87_9AGAR|nr:major facilitator superfamily domain-containing protein [Mycena maculata]
MPPASFIDEHVPLLQPQSVAPPYVSWRRWLPRYSGTTLIIPLALICRVATLLPTTTTFFILQRFICRNYYRTNDPAHIPPYGEIPEDVCAVPTIDANYAAFVALLSVLEGFGSLGGYAALSFLAARLGRCAAMAVVMSIGLSSNIALVCSNIVPIPWLEAPLIVLWLICVSFSQGTLIAYVANIYIIDLVPEDNRTSALSSIAGWTALGSVVSFSMGGTITEQNNILSVYFVAGALWVVALLYVSLLLPESLPKSKREEFLRGRARQPERTQFTGFLESLKHYRPSRNPQTGRRNWRLVICFVHMLFAGFGSGYALRSLITIITSLYQYTPAETGYTLSVLSGTNMFVLAVAIPALVTLLRPLYIRRRRLGAEVKEETTDRLDVHIAIVSWVIEAAAYIIFGFTRTRTTQLAAVILVGCGPGYAPTVRSLVVASVEPAKQGETLGMLEIAWGLGELLSPLVMGSILSSFVPRQCFVYAAIVVFAAGMLLFVRDADRYHSPPT